MVIFTKDFLIIEWFTVSYGRSQLDIVNSLVFEGELRGKVGPFSGIPYVGSPRGSYMFELS